MLCQDKLENSACYMHDELQPVEVIRSYSCEQYMLEDAGSGPQQVCDFSLEESAWFDERYQSLTKSQSTN